MRLIPIAAVLAALLVPSVASATDADIQNIIRDGATKIAKAEARAAKAGKAFNKHPTRKRLSRFRDAARSEKELTQRIRADLLAAQPDTPNVGQGRDLICQGLRKVARGLDGIDTALGREARTGDEKKAKKSIKKALKDIDDGNELIEQGEPLAGAELTPNAPPESGSGS